MSKILIVDDNTNNRMTLKLLLEECPGCHVKEASNGKEAVQMCIDEVYDLVFMDIMMPVMDGIEATRQIRSFDQAVLIVAVSALGDDDNKERILAAGAKDYITKPINGDLFLKRFENYMALISWRQSQHKFISSSPNLFEQGVYSRASLFYLRSESDISEAWEYFLSLDTFSGELASDAVQVYFNTAQTLLKKGIASELLLEENDTNYIVTVMISTEWNEPEMIQIIQEHFRGEYKIGPTSFSLLIPKNGKNGSAEPLPMGLDNDTLAVLRHSHIDKISAATYIEEMSVEFMNKLDDLDVLEESMDSAIFTMQNDAEAALWPKISSDLRAYAAVIESLFEFQHLAFAISTLANFINTLDTLNVETKNRTRLLTVLSSILGDLTNWRSTIFIQCDTNDIHYLDSSLLSSCLQAQMIFDEKANEGEDELELF